MAKQNSPVGRLAQWLWLRLPISLFTLFLTSQLAFMPSLVDRYGLPQLPMWMLLDWMGFRIIQEYAIKHGLWRAASSLALPEMKRV